MCSLLENFFGSILQIFSILKVLLFWCIASVGRKSEEVPTGSWLNEEAFPATLEGTLNEKY